MAEVKEPRQHRMVVVPHRPLHRAGAIAAAVLVALVFGYLIYQFGLYRGSDLKVEVIAERNALRAELVENQEFIDGLRQEIADLKLEALVGDMAGEEARQSMGSLREIVARQNEEINFYKGVVLPGLDRKGLRITRLDLTPLEAGGVKYAVVLAQLAEDHAMLEGGVSISVLGTAEDGEQSLPLSELDTDKQDSVEFQFRYFQEITGEMLLPEGFEPREVMVVAQLNGSKSQRAERRFAWPRSGG